MKKFFKRVEYLNDIDWTLLSSSLKDESFQINQIPNLVYYYSQTSF